MNTTFYSITRIAMYLNAIFGAFLAGGLMMAGDLLHSVITLGACAASIAVAYIIRAVEREERGETV